MTQELSSLCTSLNAVDGIETVGQHPGNRRSPMTVLFRVRDIVALSKVADAVARSETPWHIEILSNPGDMKFILCGTKQPAANEEVPQIVKYLERNT